MPLSPILTCAERGVMPMVPAVETLPFPFKRSERPNFALLFFAVEMFSPFTFRFCAIKATGCGVVRSSTRTVYLSTSICFKEMSQGFSGSAGFPPAFGFPGDFSAASPAPAQAG